MILLILGDDQLVSVHAFLNTFRWVGLLGQCFLDSFLVVGFSQASFSFPSFPRAFFFRFRLQFSMIMSDVIHL